MVAYLKLRFLAGLGATVLMAGAAEASAQDIQDLTTLSLDDLISQDVSSVAKRPQNVQEASAAVFVITQDDIRRAGATTLIEALRLAPGMEVAETPGLGAAITARGFNSTFANKLLVLVDGRAIYLPVMSGVEWRQQLVPVESIQRIEVVRGPGATLWGANAVNGVINIITEHAVDTLGGKASVDADGEAQRVFLQQGWRAGTSGAIRLYATGRQADQHIRSSGIDGLNHYEAAQFGFRYDAEPTSTDAFTLQGDVNTGALATSGVPLPYVGEGFDTWNLIGRWTRTGEAGRRTSVQAYYDHLNGSERNHHFKRDVLDLDISQQRILGRHDLIWGAGVRHGVNRPSMAAPISLPDSDATWFGGYLQDDITVTGHLKLSLGTKIEHNSYTGMEVQPSLRATWRDPRGWTAWAAISRATRTPSDFEALATIDARALASTLVLPGAVDAEVLLAIEAGWRGQIGSRVTLDATIYHNDYSGLLGWRGGLELVGGAPTMVLRLDNLTDARADGVEASLDVRVTDRWTLKATGSWMEMEIDPITGTTLSLGALTTSHSPKSQVSIRSQFDVTPDVDFDVALRHVDALGGGFGEGYTNLDARLAWRLTPRIEAAVMGKNLLGESRREYIAIPDLLPEADAVVDRQVRFSLRARF